MNDLKNALITIKNRKLGIPKSEIEFYTESIKFTFCAKRNILICCKETSQDNVNRQFLFNGPD